MHFKSGLGVSELCESEWVGDMCVVCMYVCMYVCIFMYVCICECV